MSLLTAHASGAAKGDRRVILHPGAKAATAAATLAASGAAASVNTWFAIASSAATVVGAAVALYGLRRRRRRTQPRPPEMPAPLPITRDVTKAAYAQALAEWEIYRARRDQFDQDQKGQG